MDEKESEKKNDYMPSDSDLSYSKQEEDKCIDTAGDRIRPAIDDNLHSFASTSMVSPQIEQVIGELTVEKNESNSYESKNYNKEKTGDNRMQNNETESIGQLDDDGVESEENKAKKDLKWSNRMVEYLRNLKNDHPGAADKLSTILPTILLMLAFKMPLYGKAFICLLGLSLIVLNHIVAEKNIIGTTVSLGLVILLAFFLLARWPTAANIFVVLYALLIIKFTVDSWNAKDYVCIFISIFGTYLTVILRLNTHWIDSEEIDMIWACKAVCAVFIVLLFEMEDSFRKNRQMSILQQLYLEDSSELFINRCQIEENKEEISDLKRHIRKAQTETLEDQMEVDECIERKNMLKEEIRSLKKKNNEIMKENGCYESDVYEINETASFCIDLERLRSFRKSSIYALISASIFSGLFFMLMVPKAKAYMLLGACTISLLYSMKHNALFGRKYTANSSV
ncbi:hypothetical protein NEMIN01_0505 [Nematocida minor]|uniref:uncharacterized protein n=1 Tax=Nematocida minor TaxID=1912983 RepID=UPI00221F8A7C|nr:uncharacterized protein NEMIN01_0505 [Nematocida minor]KAI5189442.1 hypothetical protein NEMIN01_0505 [Nematocida minor]